MRFEFGALFDMDGVIVDNSKYHVLAYEKWCEERSVDFDRPYFEKHLFGKQNHDILRTLLGRELHPGELEVEDTYKEGLYRKVYADHRQPVSGLIEFIKDLKRSSFGLAVATSGPPENVEFILNGIGAEGLFDEVVTNKEVKKGKPNPQVFLLAAEKLGLPPQRCVVFEDSMVGAQAAAASGAALIGVATGREQLDHAARMIKNFTEITAAQVARIIGPI